MSTNGHAAITDTGQASLMDLFAAQATRMPDAVALICEDEDITYADLARRAGRMAVELRSLGIMPGDLVAVLTERSIEAIIAFLAILKAGAAYVPLDPAYPAEALAVMLEDSAPPLLLVQKELADRFASLAPAQGKRHVLEDVLASAAAHTPDSVSHKRRPDDPAYVMYTSGSTGKPKGVLVPDRAIMRLVRGQNYADFGPDETFLHLSPLAFDASTFEIWGTLLNGGRLGIVAQSHPSLEEIGRAIARYRATTAWFTAGLFHLLVDHRLEDLRPLRRLLAGGDVLSPAHIARAMAALPDCRFVNGYGPTENTTFTCCYVIPREGWGGGALPIGLPIAHGKVHLLGPDMEVVPDGEVGQLCASGDGLALGYLNRPDLTAEKFVDNPNAAGERLYLTGDLARRRPDGVIEFFGRADRQVKINGKRVELDEIENSLRADPRLADAIVIIREDVPGRKRLTAYLKPAAPWPVPAEEHHIRDVIASLRARMPEHMIPADVVVMEAFPLNPNGKVDRKQLSPPRRPALQAAPAPDKASEAERALAAIWRRVLGVADVPREANFFDLGGTSLQILAVHAAIAEELGVSLPIVSLFKHSTIRTLSAHLTEAGPDNAASEARTRAARQAEALSRLRRVNVRAGL